VKLLLDTCTALWIATEDPRLSARAREAFTDPSNEVHLSSVSVWEIALKHFVGRLELRRSPERIVAELHEQYRLTPLPLDSEAALQTAKLPQLHRDPFDRALVAQAIIEGLVLLTPDEVLHRYPARTLW
jgi:PIN domain nuclease of toxin-antitoxin system